MGDIMSTVGNILSTLESILSTVEGVQYCGGYLEYCGGYLEYCGGYHEYHGGYQVPWGCSVLWGISWVPWRLFSTVGGIFCYLSTPWYWTPHGTHDIPTYPPRYSSYVPTCIMTSSHGTEHPTVLKISLHLVPWVVILSTMGDVQYHWGYHDARGGISWVLWRVFSTVGGKSFVIWVLHGTEHPPRYSWYPPTCIMISPHGTQISKDGIPHGTHGIPHGAHDIPPQYWTPPRHCTHIIQDDLLNWRSWKIQTWHDDRHAVHQCFCTKYDSWYLDLTSSILSELDIHFYRILLISQYFLQFKSTSELKFGLLVAWLMMNILADEIWILMNLNDITMMSCSLYNSIAITFADISRFSNLLFIENKVRGIFKVPSV